MLPTAPYLVVPESSSERREYIPIGWLEPPTIPSNKLNVLQEATLADFALLTSTMHMEMDAPRRRTNQERLPLLGRGGVQHVPHPTSYHTRHTQAKLEPVAQAVLDARAAWPGSTLADLYDPDLMPPHLGRAHQNLNRAVDRLYGRTRFASRSQRFQHLLTLYHNPQKAN